MERSSPVTSVSPTAPPTESWRLVALNAYGERVEEDASGHRRVASAEGWYPESALPGHRACRLRTRDDAAIATASLARPDISGFFKHDPDAALRVWRTLPGTPLEQTPAPPAAMQAAFALAVERARGETALRAWLHGRLGGPDWLAWPRFLRTPSATSLRGIQAGLARRLRAAAPGRVLEQGLMEAIDAATLRLPQDQRDIRAQASGNPALPVDFTRQAAWSHPGAREQHLGASPHLAEHTERAPFDALVLWVTQPALQAWGRGLSMWWPHLAAGARGWVVFDASEAARTAERAFIAALGPGHPRAARVEVTADGAVVAAVWETGLPGPGFERSVDILAFAGHTPVLATPHPPLPEDEQGRVPWRSPLAPAQGEGDEVTACAPRRLAFGMQSAFVARATAPEAVRQRIAAALAAAPADLDDRLVPEQQDAVFAALDNLDQGKPFLLADETGFGKGRVLAAVAAAATRRNLRAVFVTENDTLFSDFLRDLHAVSPGAPLPFMLHSTATLFDQQGAPLARRKGLADLRAAMAGAAPPLIVTTYATVSRKDSEERLAWLLEQMKPGAWLILDEAHNATGKSLAATGIERLVRAASATLYASATFAASEANLGLYAELLPRRRALRGFIRTALATDARGRLREAVTESLAATGVLMRREHPPVPPPVTVWVEETPAIATARAALAAFWNGLLLATERRFAHEDGGPRVWLRHGGAMARTLREFSMLAKTAPLCAEVLRLHAAGTKPVVTTDSTLEAALLHTFQPVPQAATVSAPPPGVASQEDALAAEDDIVPTADPAKPGMHHAQPPSGPGPAPLWRDRLRVLLRETFPEDWAHVWPASPAAHHAVAEPLRQALAALDAIPASWTLSPLDALRQSLEDHGIRCGELSGRRYRITATDAGWKAVPRNDPAKQASVRAFNEGEVDVLVITRAGSTGISLHAAHQFGDTRQRAMLEWDIPANPIHRWQFRGRVHRRGELSPPRFETLELDTLFERRRVEREAAKASRLGAHLGAAATLVPGWLSPPATAAVEEWATQFPDLAATVGVYEHAPAGMPLPTPLERTSRLLARALVLPAEESSRVSLRLDRAVTLSAQALARRTADPCTRPSHALRRVFWWGDDAIQVPERPGLDTLRVDAVERIWPAPPAVDPDALRAALATSPHPSGPEVLAAMSTAWRNQGLRDTRANRALWAAASNALRNLPRGAHVSLIQAETGLCTHAMVLGVEPPPSGDFALSQIGVWLWEMGRPEPEWRSVQALVRDRFFAVRAQTFDFARLPPAAPHVALLMEGNPVAAARFGQRHGLGRRTLVEDRSVGEVAGWLLPATVSIETLLAMPRDLIDADHAMAFLRHHPGDPMLSATPPGQAVRAESTQGALWLSLTEAALAAAQEGGWLDYRTSGLLDRVHVPGNPGVTLRCANRQVPQLLHAMDVRGLGWRIDATHAAWYAHTSRQILHGKPTTRP